MTIYVDVVLIENLCMNYIILFATSHILKIKRNHIRLIISSLIGSIYSIIVYLSILEIYSNIFCKIILSIIMVYVAYRPQNIKEMVKDILFFYLISFLFGGCAFALLYFIKPEEIFMKNGMYVGTYPLKITVLGGIVGFVLSTISFKFIKSRISKKDIYCNVNIYFENNVITTKALVDTGNMLKDPITNMPVMIIEKELLKNKLPNIILDNLENIIGGDVPKEIYEDENLNFITKFRVIPFSSIGKKNGMILGFKVNKVELYEDDMKKMIKNVIVGIYEDKLSRKNQYSALIGLDLIEGSDTYYESTANVSR